MVQKSKWSSQAGEKGNSFGRERRRYSKSWKGRMTWWLSEKGKVRGDEVDGSGNEVVRDGAGVKAPQRYLISKRSRGWISSVMDIWMQRTMRMK